jgi:predicted ArsR family transcriptional regulator
MDDGDAPAEPRGALWRLLDAEGFAPERGERAGREAIVLHRCPFADVASVAPAQVCALHEGVVAGFCAATGFPEAHLVPAGPRSGRCAICWD